MYIIVINNFNEKKQTSSGEKYLYYANAVDAVENLAHDFIIKKEGEKYFLKKPHYKTKHTIVKGYAMVMKKSSFNTKITIFHKEQNGIFLSGALSKVIQFQTVKIEPLKIEGGILEDVEFCEKQIERKKKIIENIKQNFVEDVITTPV